ncbi:MAG: hypothetical protein GY906_27755 [bacterium]|nr:hypothetical protein [bacterium]
MELITRLIADHQLIDSVGGSLLSWWDEVRYRNGNVGDLGGYVEFLSRFVCGVHHRGEEIIFTTLADQAEVPARHGPIAVLRHEHQRLAQANEDLSELIGRSGDFGQADDEIVRKLVHMLWEHVDKENSVLFPQSLKRLQQHGVAQLDPPLISEGEKSAREIAEALVDRYKPIDDPDVVRGDGCMACSVFSESCHGIEAEWWSSWERSHYRSYDDG